MLSEFDKWPLILQIFAMLGALGAGALVYLRGRKAAPVPADPLAVELLRIREDFALTTKSLQISVNDQVEVLEKKVEINQAAMLERVHNIESDVKVLYDRHQRNPEGPRGRRN